MDRLQLMAIFVAVAEEEGFAKAARRLALSAPSVTRAVAMLEQRLAAKLLNRTTHFVRVTDAGQRYLEDARRILADVREAEEAITGINAAPHGNLAVTASLLFGRTFVLPLVIDYLQRYPEMTVTSAFFDRVVNLLEEGFDVGVRIGDLPDSSLRAIRVANVRRVVCAAPAYLAEKGVPKAPADLTGHSIVASTGLSPSNEWRFGNGQKAQTVRLQPRLTVSSNDAAIEAAARGFGIIRLLSYQVAPHLATGQLRRVLVEYEPPHIPVHVLHREGRYASAKVRGFVDLAVERLRADPTLT